MTMQAGEQWRPVVGFEGRYEVSDHGRVRSLPRVIPDSWGRNRRWPGKIMTSTLTGTPPYPTVALSNGKGGRNHRIHVLVAAAFLGPRPDGHYVRHLDDDISNNLLSNIAYGTPAENTQDCIRNGHHLPSLKTHCKHGHELTPENVWTSPNGGRRRICKQCNRRNGALSRAARKAKRSAA